MNSKAVVFCVFPLIIAVLGMFLWASTLKRDVLELQVRANALQAAEQATQEAIELRDQQRYSAAAVAKRKRDVLNSIAESVPNRSDDELLFELKRMCEEDRVCLSDSPGNASK